MASASIAAAWLLTVGLFGYGPVEDHSEFTSAQLTEERRQVIFAAHHFAYRPATGWRAFPDGGIPRYLKDANLVGTFDLHTGKIRTVLQEKNVEWQPGSGLLTIQAVNSGKVLLVQGGQLRGPFRLATKYILMDLASGHRLALDLRSDLARYRRTPAQIYLVDGNGTLVIITSALEGPDKASGEPEIWVRKTSGDYARVALSSHYECTRAGEVIYWEPKSRNFIGYTIATGQSHLVPGYKTPGYQDVTSGVIVSSDHRQIQLGSKVDGQWQYRPLFALKDLAGGDGRF